MRHPWPVPVMLLIATATALAQRDELAVTPLSPSGVCRREGAKLVGTQPVEAAVRRMIPTRRSSASQRFRRSFILALNDRQSSRPVSG